MTAVECKEELRSWVLKKNSKINADELKSDTALLEKKLLSSLHIMDLLLHIEKLTGKRTDLTQLKPEAFRSIDSIFEHFFKGVK